MITRRSKKKEVVKLKLQVGKMEKVVERTISLKSVFLEEVFRFCRKH